MMTVIVPFSLTKDIASIAAAPLGPLSLRLATVTTKAARAVRTTGIAVSSARCLRGRGMTDPGTGVAMIWLARSVNAAGEARRAASASVTGAVRLRSSSGMAVIPLVLVEAGGKLGVPRSGEGGAGEFGGEPYPGAVETDA